MSTFQNPVIRGFNPDPTICVVRGPERTDYFLSTSTFEYFPGCAIYHSTDLINWELIGHALTRRSQAEMRTVEPGYVVSRFLSASQDGFLRSLLDTASKEDFPR